MIYHRAKSVFLALAAMIVGILSLTCVEEIDMTRDTPERGTLGEEIYLQLHRDFLRAARYGDEKAAVLESMREDFIWAIDSLLPEDEIPAFEELLIDFLPLTDSDLLPDLVRKLAFIYDDVVADEELRETWVLSEQLRTGFVQEDSEMSVLERLVGYPELRDLTLFTVELILEHDGVDLNGAPAPEENDFFYRILSTMRDSYGTPADPEDLHRNIVIATELMLQSDVRFAIADSAAPIWAVGIDPRGVPSAPLNFSFTDADGDGYPDVDGDGAFVARDQETFVVRPYGIPNNIEEVHSGWTIGRDELGRAFGDGGAFVYDYLELNRTPLGYLTRRAPEMVDDAVLNNLFIGLEGLLGDLDYSSDVPRFLADTVLLDVASSLMTLAEFGKLPELLDIVTDLTRDHDDLLASMLLVMEQNGDINDRWAAELEPNNAMLDDLLPYLYEFSQYKGLMSELLDFVQDPMFSAFFDEAWPTLNGTYNDAIRPALDGPYNTSVAPCIEDYEVGTRERFDCIRAADNAEIFAGHVDHLLPEGPGNTSLHQRSIHLLYDASGAPFDMIIEEVEVLGMDLSALIGDLGSLITIPDMAAAFLDSIVGEFCLEPFVNVDMMREDDMLSAILDLASFLGLAEGDEEVAELVVDIVVFLSDSLGVHLDACPTAAQALRFFNLPEFTIDTDLIYMRLQSPTCNAGYVMGEHHGDTLYAFEAAGGVDAYHGLLTPFAVRGLTPLVGETFAAFYRHYPEPGADYRDADGDPQDLAYSGFRRYEPALIEVAEAGRMTPVVQDLIGAISEVDLPGDLTSSEVLEELLGYFLDPDAGVENLYGSTVAVRGDGYTTPMTRFYMLSDAVDALDAELDDNPEAQDAWEEASAYLEDLMLEVIENADGSGSFADPGSAALVAVLTEHLAGHVRRHMVEGDWITGLNEDYPTFLDTLVTSRGMAAIVEMLRTVRESPEDQALFDDFLVYMSEATGENTRTAQGLLYSLLLATNDRVGFIRQGPFFENLVDPDRRFDVATTADLPLLTHGAMVLQQVMEIDQDEVGIRLIRRALATNESGESPIGVLGRLIREINRRVPGSNQPRTAADLEHHYENLSDFIRDDLHGLERVFELIQQRAGRHVRIETQ